MEAYDKIKKSLAVAFMHDLDNNRPEGKMCLSNGECADIEKAFNEQDWPKLARYLDKYTESEDERVRKGLIDFVNHYRHNTDLTSEQAEWCKKALAYLEKQKENPKSAVEVLARAGLKPYKDGNQWCILAGDNIQEGICGFGYTIDEALYQFLMEVLEKQKEQNHDGKKWIYEDEYKKDLDRLYNEGKDEVLNNPTKYGLQKEQKPDIELIQRTWYMEGYQDREHNREPEWIVKTGEGGPRYEENPKYGKVLKEQKPVERNQNDEKEPMEIRYAGKVYKVHGIREFPGGRNGYIIEDEPGHYDCIINPDEVLGCGYGIKGCGSPYPTKEITFEEKPVEWSEKDERVYSILLNDFKQAYEGRSSSLTRKEIIDIYNFIKSLRPSWKPSEDEERLINTSISFLKDFADKGYENAVECVDWLKSKLNGNSGK